MKQNKLASSLVALSLLMTIPSYAADIEFSGFSTISAGVTTSSDESINGFTSDLDFNQGSLFALQTSSDLGNGLSVTAQLIARGEDDWDPRFEWAYLSYEFNDNFKILAGRQRAPFFMYSDFLDVSYAYNWITPPRGVYDLAFDSFDGLGFIHTAELGQFDSSLHIVAGRNQDTTENAGVEIKPDFNKLVGAAWTVNRDWLTLRAAYFETTMTLPIGDEFASFWGDVGNAYSEAGFTEIGADLVNVGNSIRIEDDVVSFAELGFQVDYNDYIIVGEYTLLDQPDTAFADRDAFYVTVGKRFDSITAHVTYGENESELDNKLTGIASDLPGIEQLYLATQGLVESSKLETKYLTVGMRWDFHKSAALKFDVTKFEDDLIDSNDATLLNIALVTVF